MARNFRQYLRDISPPWLLKPDGFGVRLMQGTIGYLSDMAAEGATQGIRAPWVRQASSPPDALPGIGANFAIEQSPGETGDQYRDRLSDNPGAWVLWQEAATIKFAANAFAPFGVPSSSVTFRAVKDWTVANPGNWSRFWIVLQPPLPWAEATWGGTPWGTWGTLGTWGTDAILEQIFGVIKLICKWKSAEEVGVEIILLYPSGTIWGLGTWGSPRTFTGQNGVVRWPLGRFWGASRKPKTWGDKEPYRPHFDLVWGGKIKA